MPPRHALSNDRRRKRVATAISLAFHVLAAVLFGAVLRALVPPHEDRSAPIETITISKRTPPPKIAARAKPRAAPQPQVAVVPPPPPVAPPHAIVVPPVEHVLSHPSHRQAPIVRSAAPPVRAPVVHAPPVASRGSRPGHVVPGRARLSSSQIASIQSDLAGAIAEDRAAQDPTRVASNPEPVATPKDYGSSFGSFDDIGDARRGHGLCDPMSNWVDGGFDYYYVACEVHLSDGGQERQIVPWPVRFPPNNNPFNGTAKGSVPLAMPLPGWHKDATTVISAELRQYAKDNGVDL